MREMKRSSEIKVARHSVTATATQSRANWLVRHPNLMTGVPHSREFYCSRIPFTGHPRAHGGHRSRGSPPLRVPFTGFFAQRLGPPLTGSASRRGSLPLRAPFTGFFAQRLGPPLTAGFQAPIISAAPFTGLPVFRLEPMPEE